MKCKHNPCARHNDERCCATCYEADECEFTCGYMEAKECEHKEVD